MLIPEMKPRKRDSLPPERLLQIMRGIWPQEVADQKFIELMMEEEDSNAETGEERG